MTRTVHPWKDAAGECVPFGITLPGSHPVSRHSIACPSAAQKQSDLAFTRPYGLT